MIFKGTVPSKQSVKTMITAGLLLWNFGKNYKLENYGFKLEWAQEFVYKSQASLKQASWENYKQSVSGKSWLMVN